jgi:heme-degrading monooxygenase HmoA
MFVYLWEYEVAPVQQSDFEREYGPDGAWVALFSRASGYLGTSLLRDRTRSDRYVTIDRWESEEAHAGFLEKFRSEFDELDARCEQLTQSETLIGLFHSAGRDL